MSAHLVETSEEDSYLAVAQHFATLLNNGQEQTALVETEGSKLLESCKNLLEENRFAEVVEELVPHLNLIFEKAKRTDVECCINIICHLVAKLPPQQALPVGKKVAAALTLKVEANDKPDLRLQGLAELHNVAEDAATQHAMLLQSISYAKKADLANLLAPVIRARAELWIKEWHLSPSQSRDLYLACADLLRTVSKKRKSAARDAYRLTLRCLASFEDASTQDLASVKGVSAAAVTEFIRSPDVFQFDLLESPAVAQLKGDAQYGKLWQLLQIVLDGDLKAFESFDKSSLAALEISQEELLLKLRLTALMALSSKSHVVSFQAVQQALGLQNNAEVEQWIVRAIGKRLVEGRIDQLRGSFSVSKCSHRTFTTASWQQLREQLGAWKNEIRRVQDTISQQRQSLGLGQEPPASYPVLQMD